MGLQDRREMNLIQSHGKYCGKQSRSFVTRSYLGLRFGELYRMLQIEERGIGPLDMYAPEHTLLLIGACCDPDYVE